MSLNLGELVGYIQGDDSGIIAALDHSGAHMHAFQQSTNIQLAQIDHAFQAVDATITPDADTAHANAQLDEVADHAHEVGAADPTVDVDVDAGHALAELHEVDRAERNLGRGSGIGALRGFVSGLAGDFVRLMGSIGGAAGQAGLMAGVIGAVIPVVAALVAGLANVAPAAAVGATAVFALAQAVSVVKIGTSGIGGAFKAAFAPAVSGGGGAAKAAGQAAGAMRAVKDATEQAAQANTQAARQVADAERQVADAQRQATAVQADLNDVREQATRDLQDMNASLADAYISQEQAVLDVQTAQEALDAAQAAGSKASAEDIRQAEIDYERAVQRLKQQQTETARLAEDTAEANKAGVEGSETMVAARDKIADANLQVKDQERALADAREQQARTAKQGLESIQRAQEALASSGAAAGGGGGGVDKLGQALAKLSPNARAFVMQVIALRGAWTSMQQAVQNSLFEGLAGSLKSTASSVLPVLRTNLVATAGALNLMALGALGAAKGVAEDGTLGKAMAGAAAGLRNLAGIPGIFIKSLTQVAAAAAPAFQALTAAAGRGAAGIGEKIDKAFKSGRLQKAIEQAIAVIKQLGAIAVNVFSIIGSVFAAADQGGGSFLDTLQTITKALATAFKSDAVQDGLRALFQTIGLIARTAAPLLIQALGLIGPVLVALAPPIQQMVKLLGSVLGQILTGLGPVLVTTAEAFGDILLAFSPLISALPQLLGPIGALVSALAAALVPVMTTLGPVLVDIATTVGEALVPIVQALGPVLAVTAGAVASMVTAFLPLLPIVGEMIAALGPILVPILEIVGDLFTGLAPVIAQLGKSLLPPFLKLAQGLAAVFEDLEPVLGSALKQLGTQGLMPIIVGLGDVLGEIVTQYSAAFLNLFQQLLPVIPQLVPVLVQLGQSLGQILTAVAPLVPQLALMGAEFLTTVLPAILPLIPPLADLTVLLLQLATWVILKVVIPAINAIARVFQGLRKAFQPAIDAVTWLTTTISGAFEWLYDHLVGHSVIPDLINSIVAWFALLPIRAAAALASLGVSIARKAAEAGVALVRAVRRGLDDALGWIAGLPSRVVRELGDLSLTLFKSGQKLVGGFIAGIRSMGDLTDDAAGKILGKVDKSLVGAGTGAGLATRAATLAAPGGGGGTVSNAYDHRSYTTYNVTSRDMSVRDLETLTRRQEVMARVGRPR